VAKQHLLNKTVADLRIPSPFIFLLNPPPFISLRPQSTFLGLTIQNGPCIKDHEEFRTTNPQTGVRKVARKDVKILQISQRDRHRGFGDLHMSSNNTNGHGLTYIILIQVLL
jgi:hypothetical protein